ncbi:hypothetical protein NDU88_003041 [Pleurodeles waltl]|uniref:phospholipase A2 n=1 Tax=Pleurodeles waltl TaxID=8319 RepID=A0AAV7UBD8_PLEWA|nr:hypothetical protein NDU88_003041 [Pleurodeles waltl]
MQGLFLLWACWAGGLLGTGDTQESGGSVCGQTTPLPTLGHILQQVSDGLQLVSSTLDAKGQLVSCELKGTPEAVGAFMLMCRAGSQEKMAAGTQYPGLVGTGGTEGQGWQGAEGTQDPEFEGFAGARLACQIFLKDRGTGTPRYQPQPHDEGGLQRSRRGFTYPGTLWCGAGNSAKDNQQLGELKETDACCREHDHCQHVIHPFTSNYGYRNMRWHTISHCACDNEMKDCLRRVNDTASRVVGQAFFNVIQVPCFEFMYEEQCVERFWYGWCKRYNKVAVAVPQPPVLYDYGGYLIDRVPTTNSKNQIPQSSTPPQGSNSAQATGTSGGTKAQPFGTTAQSHRTTSGQLGSKDRSLGTTAHPPGITVEHSSDSSKAPTLGQVIQVTEDLLKVMVTTISPTTTSETRTESAGKKQSKNKKKKKEGKKRRKGKGLKGKKKVLPGSENLTPTSLVVSATPPVANKDPWVESLGKARDGELEHLLFDQSLDLGGKQVVFNDVLNDEPGRDEVKLSKSTLATLTTNHPTKKTMAPTPTKPTVNAEGQKKRRKVGKGRKRLRENARSTREELGI